MGGTGVGRARGRGRRPARLEPELGWALNAGRAPTAWPPPGRLSRPDHRRLPRTSSLRSAGAAGAPRPGGGAGSAAPSLRLALARMGSARAPGWSVLDHGENPDFSFLCAPPGTPHLFG